jgi:hypothetical protein
LQVELPGGHDRFLRFRAVRRFGVHRESFTAASALASCWFSHLRSNKITSLSASDVSGRLDLAGDSGVIRAGRSA